MSIIYFLVCLGASIVGAISGIGGGVIIKPTLDIFGTMDVATISFLSGCTVLAMTIMTLLRNRHSEVKIDKQQGTYLAVGAAVGGIVGKQIFDIIKNASGNEAMVGMIQSFLLALITFGVLIFTLQKSKITPYQAKQKSVASSIGFFLGLLSAFLGIGGGPINLAVLYLLFGMDTKTAALNSLYIIFFSQITSLVHTLILGKVPVFEWSIFIMMIGGGILGGFVGSSLSKKLSIKGIDKVYIVIVMIIVLISIYNGVGYMNLMT